MSHLTARLADEHLDTLTPVLQLIRTGTARTRPQLGQAAGLGRSVVAQRVATLLECGLVEEVGLGASTGGRAPRELRLRAEAGVVLVAALGAVTTAVGVADLSGHLVACTHSSGDIAAGPEAVLGAVGDELERLLADLPGAGPVYGVGVGLPGPVEFASGRPVSPPIMPGWDGYDVREALGRRFRAPVWVDNDVNLLALGELRAGRAVGERDVIYVKVGTGIGSGLVSGGVLHRGAHGCAGDIGHVDADGDLHLVDRKRELVIVSGFNVYPSEVERVLLEHPGVREAAVIGVPHPYTGESVTALVVRAEGSRPTAEELIAHCARSLARFKCPTAVEFVAELPQSATGKVSKARLREGAS